MALMAFLLTVVVASQQYSQEQS